MRARGLLILNGFSLDLFFEGAGVRCWRVGCCFADFLRGVVFLGVVVVAGRDWRLGDVSRDFFGVVSLFFSGVLSGVSSGVGSCVITGVLGSGLSSQSWADKREAFEWSGTSWTSPQGLSQLVLQMT